MTLALIPLSKKNIFPRISSKMSFYIPMMKECMTMTRKEDFTVYLIDFGVRIGKS